MSPRITLVILCALILGGQAATAVEESDSAELFVRTKEAAWQKFKSPAIKEAYPFGRSDQANNTALDKVFDFSSVSKETSLTNKHFLTDGDWYAVEWFYHATDAKTGRRQIECSLCLAQVKNQELVQWIEYFDDKVGELQMAGKIPLYDDNEPPFPWPAAAGRRQAYRP